MSIPVVENPSITYVGDGQNREWEYPYDFSSYDVVKLLKIDEDGKEIAVTKDYTYKPNTKIFIYPINEPPLTSKEKLVLYRQTPIKQSAVLPDLYPYSNIVDEFDYIIMILQEQNVLSREGIKQYIDLRKRFEDLEEKTTNDVASAVASMDEAVKAVNATKEFILGELAKTTADVDEKIKGALAKIDGYEAKFLVVERDIESNGAKIDVVKTEITTVDNKLSRVEGGIVGRVEGDFPVTNGKKGSIYKHVDSYYMCKVDGANASVPDGLFEEVTLNSLYKMTGKEEIEQLTLDVVALENGKEDKGVAKTLVNATKSEIKTTTDRLTQEVSTNGAEIAQLKSGKEDKGVAAQLDKTLETKLTNKIYTKENKGVAKGLVDTVQNELSTFKVATVGDTSGTFPVTNGVKENVYYYSATNKYYKCITNGANATTPNANFEELSLKALSNKSGGGGGGDYDELKRKVAALETGKENKGVAQSLVNPLGTKITALERLTQTLMTGKENKGVAQSLIGPLENAMHTAKSDIATLKSGKENVGVAIGLDEKIVGQDNIESFPLGLVYVGDVYKAANGRYYKCISPTGNAYVPDEHFEEVSLKALSNKSGGGGGGAKPVYDKLLDNRFMPIPPGYEETISISKGIATYSEIIIEYSSGPVDSRAFARFPVSLLELGFSQSYFIDTTLETSEGIEFYFGTNKIEVRAESSTGLAIGRILGVR